MGRSPFSKKKYRVIPINFTEVKCKWASLSTTAKIGQGIIYPLPIGTQVTRGLWPDRLEF